MDILVDPKSYGNLEIRWSSRPLREGESYRVLVNGECISRCTDTRYEWDKRDKPSSGSCIQVQLIGKDGNPIITSDCVYPERRSSMRIRDYIEP